MKKIFNTTIISALIAAIIILALAILAVENIDLKSRSNNKSSSNDSLGTSSDKSLPSGSGTDRESNAETGKAIAEKLRKQNPDFWKEPTGKYPDLSKVANLNILVDTDKQLTYIRDGENNLTSFVVSTGIFDGESETPKGEFKIESERGESFFAAEFQEGANYWVSFKDHGIYLFHSVPTDHSGNYIPNEAVKLGEPASHGCVRMSVSDSKWIFENIPVGTPVKVI